MGVFISPKDLKESINQSAPADSISIIRRDDGAFFVLLIRKGQPAINAKKMMCDDIDTLVEFMRGFFPSAIPEPTPKNSPENFGKPRAIGFLAEAA
jgi:hypothetical protein